MQTSAHNLMVAPNGVCSWTRPIGLAAWLVLGLLAGACSRTPPNVLLISLDATRADHLSAYGYSRETPPFLAELASRGVRFSNAFVNTHGTVPSHTTILSSEYAESHRALGADQPGWSRMVPEDVALLPEILKRQGYVTLGVTDGGWMSAQLGFNRGFDTFHETDGILPGTTRLMSAIAQHVQAEKPIFAFLHTYQIHSPYDPPDGYRTRFGEFPGTFVATSANLLQFMNDSTKLSDADLTHIEALYDAEIRFTDDTLRAFWKQLDASGFLRNALIVVKADHGEEFGEHGGLLHRPQLFDELLRVPLIIAGNGVPSGVVDDRLAGSVDIVPTIMAHLGFGRAPRWAGTNLLAPTPVPHDEQVLFSQYASAIYSVRTHDWKLIRRPGGRALYDLQLDPGEQVNVANQKGDVVRYLEKKLDDWRRTLPPPHVSTGAPELTPEQRERLKSLGYLQ